MTNNTPPPVGKKTGKAMMIIAWIIGLVLATKFFAVWEDNKINPNKSPQSATTENYTEVILNSGRGGHYIANGYINNQSVVFMLDTGATSVSLSEALAYRLNLKKGMTIDLSTANGVAQGWTTTLNSVRLGTIEINNVSAIIVSNMEDEVLLGMSFLRYLEFSQRNKQLVLRQYKSN